jgi:hypothetical protein
LVETVTRESKSPNDTQSFTYVRLTVLRKLEQRLRLIGTQHAVQAMSHPLTVQFELIGQINTSGYICTYARGTQTTAFKLDGHYLMSQ